MNKRLLVAIACGLGAGLIAVGVIAAGNWISTRLQSSGTINATQAPTYNYTVSSTLLSFPNTTGTDGDPFSINSGDIIVTNTGNQTINGLQLTLATGSLPAGWTPTLAGSGGSIAPSATATVHVNIAGTLQNFDLSTVSFDLTPN